MMMSLLALLPVCLSAPLPANLPTPLTYSTCEGCEEPMAVVLAGVFDTPAAAQAATARLPGTLPPGYPFSAHTEELPIASDRAGIAVVAGFFPDTAAADAWRAASGLATQTTTAPLDGVAHRERLEAQYADRELTPIPHLISFQLHHSGGSAVYAADVVRSEWQRGSHCQRERSPSVSWRTGQSWRVG
ncbi:MAG: hypothetical protein ACI8S6_001527 [Myxococcota bacterium]|jgi:hypothetical protein